LVEEWSRQTVPWFVRHLPVTRIRLIVPLRSAEVEDTREIRGRSRKWVKAAVIAPVQLTDLFSRP